MINILRATFWWIILCIFHCNSRLFVFMFLSKILVNCWWKWQDFLSITVWLQTAYWSRPLCKLYDFTTTTSSTTATTATTSSKNSNNSEKRPQFPFFSRKDRSKFLVVAELLKRFFVSCVYFSSTPIQTSASAPIYQNVEKDNLWKCLKHIFLILLLLLW